MFDTPEASWHGFDPFKEHLQKYGFVFQTSTNNSTSDTIDLVNVSGTFQVGENISLSDSTETDKIVENSSNANLTISEITTFKFEDKEPSEKKSHFEMTYVSIVKIDEKVKNEKELKKNIIMWC